MMDSNLPIGIFDSGVGGLTVVNNILKIMPNEGIIYLADSKNFPYGTKSEEEIKSFSKRITKFLVSKRIKALVVACNTASSTAIEEIRAIAHELPVFGMIQYGAKYAIKTTKNKKICIISTPLTAKKHAYKNEIEKLDKDVEVFEVGSQDLVNLVEDGIIQNQYAQTLTKERLKEPLKNNIDTLVLGCTHFPFLEKVVKSVTGDEIKVIDPSDFLAEKIKEYLEKKGLINKAGFQRIFFTTGEKEDFLEKTKLFIKFIPDKVLKVDI